MGCTASDDLADLLHHLGVDRQAAGGVDDQHVAAEPACLLQTARRRADRVAGLAEHRHVDLAAERAQLLDGGGTLQVGADHQRLRPWLLNQRASLAALVVLPEPCRPAISTTVGGRLA